MNVGISFGLTMPQRIDVVIKSRVIGPITKDFVGNLSKNEYLSHLALLHIFFLSMKCEILHTCAQVCTISYAIFKYENEHVNSLWLSVVEQFFVSE